MARKSKRQRTSDAYQSQGSSLALWWRPACLCFAVALLVATPLVPTERTELTGNALPYVMLWLLLALVWFAGAALLRVPLAKLGWIDAIIVALAGWHVISGLVMMYHGAPRLTINAMWTWVSFAVIVVLLRQLVRGQVEAKALCAVMIALAVCLSMMAFYQAYVTYPGQRAYYEANPESALGESGIHAPEGSAARRQFESRLYSSEPTATFSLTNSLAGLLAPWLVFVIGVAAALGFRVQGSEVDSREPTARAPSRSIWIGLLLAVAVIALCLLLTKSRTAWLATIVGCTAVGGIVLWQHGRRKLVLLIGSQLAILAALVATLGWFNALPARIVSAAVLSLKYRFEYWQSTAAMIWDFPLFGCGPGNFQNYYTTYKLPQASETVADPHNFVMELAAVAGLPALVIFAVFIVWSLFARRAATASVDESTVDRSDDQSVSSSAVFSGFAVALPLAVTLNLVTNNYVDTMALFLGVLMGGAVLVALRVWALNLDIPSWLPPLVIGALLFNLLAAGGVSFPGVVMTLWVMIAVMTCDQRESGWQPSPLAALVIFVPLTLGLLLTCYQTAYQPVLRRQLSMGSASYYRDQGLDSAERESARQASAADPWSAQPDLFLAQLECERWSNWHDPTFLDDGEGHIQRMLALDRHSSQAEASAGYLYLLISDVETGDVEKHQKRAIYHFQRAMELYPNDAMTHAHLAMIYHNFEMPAQARESAEKALALDEFCPHEERKLANRRVFAEISVAQNDTRFRLTWRKSAEQWMHEIRNNNE